MYDEVCTMSEVLLEGYNRMQTTLMSTASSRVRFGSRVVLWRRAQNIIIICYHVRVMLNYKYGLRVGR